MEMDTCRYFNNSAQLVVLRCFAANQVLLEKVIFPFEDWCFDAPADAYVELWTQGLAGTQRVDRFEAGELAGPLANQL